MKKLLCLFLVMVLALTLAIGCSKPVQQETPAPQATAPTTTEPTTPAAPDTTVPTPTEGTEPTTTETTTPGTSTTTTGKNTTSNNNTSSSGKTGGTTSGSTDAVSSASTETSAPTTTQPSPTPKPSTPTTPKAPTPTTPAPTTPAPTTPAPTAPTTPVDTVSAASIVSDNAAFEKAISASGKWIIATTKDLTFDKPLVLTGNFKNGKTDAATGLAAIQRKIALYTQDANKNVTARFTLAAPKLTILSPNARIQSGTFKGDLYVGVPNFKLVDAVVDGNVYFTTKDAMDTFVVDAKSSVTGKQELIAVDTVSTASLVSDTLGFEKAIAKDGKWIIAPLKNLTFDKELVVTGNFVNNKPANATTGLKTLQRKIAPYTQDANKVTTGRFIITAPKMTILSPNTSIQKGIFKGDLYVGVPNFKLMDAVVDGNIYFTNKDAMDTFSADATSIVTGKQELFAVDTVSTASLVNDNAGFESAIAKDGKWIIAPLRSLEFTKALVLEGDFHDKNDPTKPLKRKIALYTQDASKVTTSRFMLSAPQLTITSTNATIQKGIFKGDVYVSALGFNLVDAVIDGNIYFTSQAAKDTFTMDATSIVTGKQEVK